MNVVANMERGEAVLWTILARFESLAAQQYARSVPALLTPQKIAVVELLQSRVDDDTALHGSPLEPALETLMQCVTSTETPRVLIGQGLFLELVGEAIYRSFGENAATSDLTRALCALGMAASARAHALVSELLRTQVGTGPVLLDAIVRESTTLLGSLDSLGEAIDATFFERFGVSFADLMGDVAAELLSMCLELGVDRRMLVAFLTSALMGA